MPPVISPYMIYAVYGAAGVQLAVSVVAGLLIGGMLDKRFGTTPWIMVAGLAMGFAGGLVNLFKIMRRYERSREKGQGGRNE